MDRELLKAKLLGMETALTEYHKLGKELEALTDTLTPEDEEILADDNELSDIAVRLDNLIETIY